MTDDPDRLAALTSGSDTWHTTGDGAGLPPLTLADGPHGVRRTRPGGDALGIGDSIPATCFPPAVSLGSTWNPALLRRVGQALGREARALGVDVLLGPGMNIKRSPLGGRNFEYLAEDPLLTGVLAAALVDGVQSAGVGACVKHFAVNNQETDRMRISAQVDERALREVYLAGFEHVVRTARPWALMSAYNRVNGVPASEHPWLLTDVLRGEWGFDGVVVSDWGAVVDRVAAVRAGCDVEMPPTGTDHLVADAVRAGTLDAAALERVRDRLHRLHERVRGTAAASLEEAQAAGAELARQAATEAAVLLKNDDAVLPLDAVTLRRIAVVGELARTPRYQGGGSSRVVPTAVSSLLDALTDRLGDAVTFAPGYRLDGTGDSALLTEALATAEGADAVVLLLGLPAEAESEGFDRTTISLPADQLRLLTQLAQVNPEIVVVLANGGVVSVAEWREHARAILEGWLPGQAGGDALADLLLGVHAPSGRLAETIPLRLADHPSHLTFPGRDGQVVYGESVFVGYRHFDAVDAPVAYPFGHGLTYTTFGYADLTITPVDDERWEIGCTVTNTGDRAGQEVVQLYTPTGLRAFTKISLEPGAERRVALVLTPRDLAVWDVRHQRWTVDPGSYPIRVGASSRDIRLTGDLRTNGDRFLPPLSATSTVGEWRSHPAGGPLLGRVLARRRQAAPIAPELLRMVDGIPLRTLRTFGVGLTEDVVAELVDQAERARADLIRSGAYRDR
ncbi:glycoside hydrolase family 3 C-terminal domain-containing protein [Cryptosporangium minutisporangium]|uniref:Glycoside hydrolase family 3 C-terminal domain-containing protein n=1 Tax=Cryptosporangium minutisporangium TaxID=113569 RepID=A0ABP6SQL1_9ACTN